MKTKSGGINLWFWVFLGILALFAFGLDNIREFDISIYEWYFHWDGNVDVISAVAAGMLAKALSSVLTGVLLVENWRYSSRTIIKNTFSGLGAFTFLLSMVYTWDAIAYYFALREPVRILTSWYYHAGLQVYWETFLFSALPIALAINLLIAQFLSRGYMPEKSKNEGFDVVDSIRLEELNETDDLSSELEDSSLGNYVSGERR